MDFSYEPPNLFVGGCERSKGLEFSKLVLVSIRHSIRQFIRLCVHGSLER